MDKKKVTVCSFKCHTSFYIYAAVSIPSDELMNDSPFQSAFTSKVEDDKD